jgi:diguanylate cyclase (GGDEF)-like protein
MHCTNALDLIWAWIDERITPEEERQLDEHLAGCPSCLQHKAQCENQDEDLKEAWAVEPRMVSDFKQRMRTLVFGPEAGQQERVSLLVVDDKIDVLRMLARYLAPEFDVLTAGSAEAARNYFSRRPIDMILSDVRLRGPYRPDGRDGVQLLEWVKENYPDTIRLLMTGHSDLETAIEAINRGKIYHYLVKPWTTGQEWLPILRNAAEKFLLMRKQRELMDELRVLNLELEKRVLDRTAALQTANEELRQKNKMLTKLALTDALTGLPNRRAMVRVAEQELRRRSRYPSPVGLGMIDVDHFKDINSRLKHTGGDRILAELAKCLQGSLRNADFLGRVGGEEFLVIAPETSTDGFATLGERIRTMVERHSFTYKDEPVKVTVSLGFAVADVGVQADYVRMKEAADAALLRAKRNGRNRLELLRLPA